MTDSHAGFPAWAGRAVVGLGALAGAALVGVPMGLGLTVLLLALGATAAAVPRPAAVPTADLRVAGDVSGRDPWIRVWWALGAALALVPVLRAATWVGLPALIAGAALASLALTGGRRWGELGAGLGALWARLPQGAALAGRASARDVQIRRAGPAARGALLAALCLLTLVVLASALKRLGLYEETFGFTRLRLAAHATLLYLGALFCLVLAARTAPWLPRAVVAVTAAAVLTFALADPDRRIADHNADRFTRTGKIDVDYLATLGPDAAPALKRIPGVGCAVRLTDGGGLAGLNLARARARRTLENCDAQRTRTVR